MMDVINFVCYLVTWFVAGLVAFTLFDDEDESLYNEYVGLEHSWQAFLFIALWPATLIGHFLGSSNDPDGRA